MDKNNKINRKISVTAKTKIGYVNIEDFDYLNSFINKMKGAGCRTFILHERKAIFKGLSPKQNLNIISIFLIYQKKLLFYYLYSPHDFVQYLYVHRDN